MSDDGWFIALIEPQMEQGTVWRLHEIGVELYNPIIRRNVKTGRNRPSGQRELRMAPKPMFPGYGFVRVSECIGKFASIKAIRGVRGFLRLDADDQDAILPAEAVEAVRHKEHDEHVKFLKSLSRKSKIPQFKPGDRVIVHEGPYADMVSTIEKVGSSGRIEMLLGMIRVSMQQEMVRAA